jgi:hypothetical protein
VTLSAAVVGAKTWAKLWGGWEWALGDSNPRPQPDLDVLVDEIDILHADALGVDAKSPG